MVIIIRRSISFFSTSLAFTSSLSARSLTVIPSASVMSLVIGGGASAAADIDGRSSRRVVVRGVRGPIGRIGGRGGGGPPGRPGIWPPGGRIGCDGSGRGPPSGGRTAGADGRIPPGRMLAPAGGGTAERVGAGGACCGRTTGRCGSGRAAGASPVSGSSMRRRRVGGTRRPAGRGGGGGAGGAGGGGAIVTGAAAATAGAGSAAGGGSTTGAVATTGGAISCGGATTSTGSASMTGVGASASMTGAGSCACSISAGTDPSPSACGRKVLINRGRSAAGAGLGGSGALPPLPGDFFCAGASAKSGPVGSAICRLRACRSTNWRATISSIELEALFTSMPVSCLSRVIASWLERPSSSATL